jgi:5-formyltetrahydrofolate cyclo-ligase
MAETKDDLRRRLRRARTDRTEHERATAGEALARHGAALEGSTIAAFVGVRSEPPTTLLLEALHDHGVRVLLPVLLADMDLDWAPFTGTADLVEGRLRMLEPAGPPLGPGSIASADLVLVPALAIDRRGRRLGQGGGSYDRALHRTSAPVVAVVFGDEVLETLPSEAHDLSVDGVLTPDRGLRWFRESPSDGTR